MFKIIGVILAFYVGYALLNGSVYAKSGMRSREILREDTPVYFWTVIVIYALLSMALIFVF